MTAKLVKEYLLGHERGGPTYKTNPISLRLARPTLSLAASPTCRLKMSKAKYQLQPKALAGRI
jgi:hypothetical protein